MTVQLPRRSLLWVMGALLLVTAPHLPHLPVGVPAVLGFSLLWRYRVYQGRWPFPSLLVKVLLVLISFIGVGLHFRTINGLDPAISLLVIAAGFKTLEMRVTRDYLVACFVGYFLAASQLLFEQEIPYAALALAGLVGVTAAMVARHQREPAPGFPSPLALAAKMLAQALPLMLVLFVVFPRIAPLWSMPQSKAAAKTGPSDTVSPGDIAQLSGSNALAFRASLTVPYHSSANSIGEAWCCLSSTAASGACRPLRVWRPTLRCGGCARWRCESPRHFPAVSVSITE